MNDYDKGYYDSAGCWNWYPTDDEPFNLDWLFDPEDEELIEDD